MEAALCISATVGVASVSVGDALAVTPPVSLSGAVGTAHLVSEEQDGPPLRRATSWEHTLLLYSPVNRSAVCRAWPPALRSVWENS